MEERDEAIRKEIEMAIKRAKNQKGAANILALLFPKVEKVLKTYVPDSMDNQERIRARRISQKDFAQSYFGLDPQPLIWTRADIESIINANQPSALLAEAQRRIRDWIGHCQGIVRSVIDEVCAYNPFLIHVALNADVNDQVSWLD